MFSKNIKLDILNSDAYFLFIPWALDSDNCFSFSINHFKSLKSFNLIFFFQVHTFEGETVQMSGMRQGFLSVQNVSCPQNSTYGRISPQVSGLQSKFQPKVESKDPFVDTHRHKTIQLFLMWEGL